MKARSISDAGGIKTRCECGCTALKVEVLFTERWRIQASALKLTCKCYCLSKILKYQTKRLRRQKY